jgi:hypothetical protein
MDVPHDLDEEHFALRRHAMTRRDVSLGNFPRIRVRRDMMRTSESEH